MTARRGAAGMAAAVLALAMLAGAARAQNINEPEVTKGQTKLETFSVFQQGFNAGEAGDTREIHNLSYNYGLTDFWQVKTFLATERPAHRGYRAAAASIENTFELVNAKKSGGYGLALFVAGSAAIDDESTNSLLVGPIVRLGEGRLSLLLNPSLEKTFGQNREEGLAFVYGWQLKHEVRKGFWVGVEGFGRIPDIGGAGGPEEHRVGPLLTWEWELAEKRTLTFETGLQLGLTDATPDRAAKVQVTYTY